MKQEELVLGNKVRNKHDGAEGEITFLSEKYPGSFSCKLYNGKGILPDGFVCISCHISNWELI